MKEKEKQILEKIRENPFISQNELAEHFQLSRSAVANYISSLMKKGEIVGRAYILREEGKIVCIGGANIDSKVYFQNEIQWQTSNPVTVRKTLGGVARNIAENLGRMGASVSLITAVGSDMDGKWLLDTTRKWVDISASFSIPQALTGNYTAILDKQGELVIALADMALYDQLNEAQIEERWNYIVSASYVLLDTNFPKKVIEKIIQKCRTENIPLCIATVSVPKVKKLPGDLTGVEILIANKDEAEALAGRQLTEDPRLVAKELFLRGLEKLVITNGKNGLYYFDKEGLYGHLPAPQTNIKDVTGAGDSLVAGVIYGLNHGFDLKTACQYGMTCSYLTLQSEQTVSEELNEKKLHETYQLLWKR